MAERLEFACGALQGSAHLSRGIPCQDSVFGARGAHAAAVALCDGAGSVPHSELAAQAASRALASYAAEHFELLWSLEDAVVRDVIVTLGVTAVREAAPGVRPACTVLLAAMAADGRSLVCHLGDGAILALGRDGRGRLFSEPENGERPNMTYFLSGPEPLRHLRVLRPEPDSAEAFVLGSDGVSAGLYSYSGAASPAVEKMVGWLRSGGQAHAAALLDDALKNVFRSQSADDVSLAILLRAGAAAEG